jgi:hypothetical protein
LVLPIHAVPGVVRRLRRPAHHQLPLPANEAGGILGVFRRTQGVENLVMELSQECLDFVLPAVAVEDLVEAGKPLLSGSFLNVTRCYSEG